MRVIRSLLGALAVAATPALAAAQTLVWSNGAIVTPPQGWGLGNRVIADDFVLGASTAIGGVRFWGYNPSPGTLNYTGTIHWRLLEAIDGATAGTYVPGTLITSGEATPIPVVLGKIAGDHWDFHRFDFTIPTQTLAAGRYYLALHDGADGDYGSGRTWYAETDSPGNAYDVRLNHGLAPGFAFELYTPTAVPEPATVALVAGGLVLVGLAGARRRRA